MDLKEFGNKLKLIRKKLNLTQDFVSEQCCITRKKIIDIEKGHTYPSIEDIKSLSKVYKINLIDLFIQYHKYYNTNIRNEIEEIESKLSDMNYNDLIYNINNLKKYQNKNIFIKQYLSAIKGFYYMKSKEQNIDKAINYLNSALKFSIKQFSINSYKKFYYSSLEYRILIALADCYRFNGDSFLYNEIVNFSYKNLEEINESYFLIRIHYAINKSLKSNFLESINSINETINLINKYKFYNYLPFLYFINHLNYKKINENNLADEYLNKALVLSECYNKLNLRDLIINKIRKK